MNTIQVEYTINCTDDDTQLIIRTLSTDEIVDLILENKSLKENNNKLTKDLKSAQDNKDYYYNANNKVVKEIDQVHDLLSALGTPAQATDADKYAERYPLLTRLTLFIANKG